VLRGGETERLSDRGLCAEKGEIERWSFVFCAEKSENLSGGP